jgi:hypothetical protein
MKIKLTPAQDAIVHGILTVLLGCAVTTLVDLYQYVATKGFPSSGQTLALFLFSTFLIALASALKSYIPSNVANFLQATNDTLNEIKQLQQQQVNSQPAAPLMVRYTTETQTKPTSGLPLVTNTGTATVPTAPSINSLPTDSDKEDTQVRLKAVQPDNIQKPS